MKKTKLLIAILVIALFAVFALGSSDSGTDDQGSQNVNSSQGNLGNYNVDINDCRVAQDYEGNPVIIIKYTFKNALRYQIFGKRDAIEIADDLKWKSLL